MATPIYQYDPSLIFCSQSHDLLSDFAQFLLPFEDGPQIQLVQSSDNSNTPTPSTLGYRLTRLDLNPLTRKSNICRSVLLRHEHLLPRPNFRRHLHSCFHGMDDEGSHWGYFPANMSYNTTGIEPIPAATPSRRFDTRTDTRKCAKWDPQEHCIFISTVEHVTTKGHRRGKCFTTAEWERIRELFN
ncbi:Hypothetical predicted protein [Olea europaea subsp. europaea]|uniref:Uncharacterized protein n=1 Tax=Olea europaea subsp. europaea TaxID=158383 RepID=A0A8S0R2Q0_OLEEU|nr:Hypothetical predicted protein [Olea europaea subsp. europaea]